MTGVESHLCSARYPPIARAARPASPTIRARCLDQDLPILHSRRGDSNPGPLHYERPQGTSIWLRGAKLARVRAARQRLFLPSPGPVSGPRLARPRTPPVMAHAAARLRMTRRATQRSSSGLRFDPEPSESGWKRRGVRSASGVATVPQERRDLCRLAVRGEPARERGRCHSACSGATWLPTEGWR
jgi:hypothetical protein